MKTHKPKRFCDSEYNTETNKPNQNINPLLRRFHKHCDREIARYLDTVKWKQNWVPEIFI